MSTIEATLSGLDKWYNEVVGGGDQHQLLAKLAMLELCGWIEERQDHLVYEAGKELGLDANWIRDQVVQGNHGFHYEDHLRKMLCKLVGEAAVLHVEEVFEADFPAKLHLLKSSLGSLRSARGVLAHTYNQSSIGRQVTINAPSWCVNQQRIIAKLLANYEVALKKAFTRTIKKP